MLYCMVCCFLFFKQKTAYEMRISDWSSDVCSSDLVLRELPKGRGHADRLRTASLNIFIDMVALLDSLVATHTDYATLRRTQPNSDVLKFGRASCRERVCPYV